MRPFSSLLIFSAAVSRALRRSPQWTGFIAGLINVDFVVVTLALRQVCLWVLWPSFVTVIPPALHICVLCRSGGEGQGVEEGRDGGPINGHEST